MEEEAYEKGEDPMSLSGQLKEEFYQIMLASTAGIYHDSLHLDFVLGDGQVKELLLDGAPILEEKKKL